MSVVQGRAERTAGDERQEYNYFWNDTASNVWFPAVPPAEITIENLDLHPTEMRLYRYRIDLTVSGLIAQFTLEPGAARTFTWRPSDPAWVGIALNAWRPDPGVLHANLIYADAIGAPCQFGTERRDVTQSLIQLTPEALELYLSRAGASGLLAALGVLFYSYLNTEDLCGLGPPEVPIVGSDFSNAPLATKIQLVKYIAWDQLCQCKPGVPAPTPYPPPVVQPIGGQPPPLVFPCDPADVCAALVSIRQQLAALAQTVTANYALSTLVQRYQAPFAYIVGATHSNLTGTGVIGIPRCIGVLVAISSRPPELKTLTGAPEYIFDLGWVSAIATNGMCDEIRLSRDIQIWQSRLIPECGTIGYAFRDGVTGSITELYAEP